MELRWSWIVIAGVVALGIVAAAAFLWPLRRQPRSLRPMAWVGRLTQLPEYRRAYRRYRILLAAIAVSTVAVLLCAIVATARPVSSQAAAAQVNREHPEEIMLCLQDDPASADASALLSYFGDQAAAFDTQSLGLTVGTQRAIPLTRDYRFLQDSLGEQIDLRSGMVDYSDYKFTVNDALALCLKGFPGTGESAAARRSVIYLGPAETAKDPIFSDEELSALVASSAVQVNVLTKTPLEAGGTLSNIAETSRGQFISYPADTALIGYLDEIRAHPPAVIGSDGTILVQQVRDRPNLVLVIGLALVVVFSVSLAGVRR